MSGSSKKAAVARALGPPASASAPAASRALTAASGQLDSVPGPVHLNVALREPLVPDHDAAWPEPLHGRPSGAAWTRLATPPQREALPEDLPARTVVLLGVNPEPAAFPKSVLDNPTIKGSVQLTPQYQLVADYAREVTNSDADYQKTIFAAQPTSNPDFTHIAFEATPGRGFNDSKSRIARSPSGVAALPSPSMLAAMFISIDPIAG